MEMVTDSRRSGSSTKDGNREIDDFLASVLPRQMEAERAIHNGDVNPRLAMWSRGDPVTVFGAAGPNRSGWREVSDRQAGARRR
jgi:hypothetical protein